MAKFTRRDVIHTFVGTTTVAMVGSAAPASAQAPEKEIHDERAVLIGPKFLEFQKFVLISAALTGITATVLAPDAALSRDSMVSLGTNASDPAQAFKLDYFKLASSDPAYPLLVKRFDAIFSAPSNPIISSTDPAVLSAAAGQLLVPSNPHDDGVAELARSIIMAWYFGVWYEWKPSAKVSPAAAPPSAKSAPPKARFTVVSADAYTQGWIWRIAQAHTPGYSNQRFGYWAFAPAESFKTDFIKLQALKI